MDKQNEKDFLPTFRKYFSAVFTERQDVEELSRLAASFFKKSEGSYEQKVAAASCAALKAWQMQSSVNWMLEEYHARLIDAKKSPNEKDLIEIINAEKAEPVQAEFLADELCKKSKLLSYVEPLQEAFQEPPQKSAPEISIITPTGKNPIFEELLPKIMSEAGINGQDYTLISPIIIAEADARYGIEIQKPAKRRQPDKNLTAAVCAVKAILGKGGQYIGISRRKVSKIVAEKFGVSESTLYQYTVAGNLKEKDVPAKKPIQHPDLFTLGPLAALDIALSPSFEANTQIKPAKTVNQAESVKKDLEVKKKVPEIQTAVLPENPKPAKIVYEETPQKPKKIYQHVQKTKVAHTGPEFPDLHPKIKLSGFKTAPVNLPVPQKSLDRDEMLCVFGQFGQKVYELHQSYPMDIPGYEFIYYHINQVLVKNAKSAVAIAPFGARMEDYYFDGDFEGAVRAFQIAYSEKIQNLEFNKFRTLIYERVYGKKMAAQIETAYDEENRLVKVKAAKVQARDETGIRVQLVKRAPYVLLDAGLVYTHRKSYMSQEIFYSLTGKYSEIILDCKNRLIHDLDDVAGRLKDVQYACPKSGCSSEMSMNKALELNFICKEHNISLRNVQEAYCPDVRCNYFGREGAVCPEHRLKTEQSPQMIELRRVQRALEILHSK